MITWIRACYCYFLLEPSKSPDAITAMLKRLAFLVASADMDILQCSSTKRRPSLPRSPCSVRVQLQHTYPVHHQLEVSTLSLLPRQSQRIVVPFSSVCGSAVACLPAESDLVVTPSLCCSSDPSDPHRVRQPTTCQPSAPYPPRLTLPAPMSLPMCVPATASRRLGSCHQTGQHDRVGRISQPSRGLAASITSCNGRHLSWPFELP